MSLGIGYKLLFIPSEFSVQSSHMLRGLFFPKAENSGFFESDYINHRTSKCLLFYTHYPNMGDTINCFTVVYRSLRVSTNCSQKN